MTKKSIGNRHDLKVNVTNTLTSTSTKNALSAYQGRVLDENKANKDTDATAGNACIFDSNGNPVDSGTNLADLNDGWDGQVNTFADLPAASANNGKKYAVISPTGTIILGTKKYAGTYISDGTNWNRFGYKQASVINQLLTGFSAHASVVAISNTDSILQAFQKTQKYFNDLLTNFNGANQLLKLDSNSKLPAVDGSQLMNLSTTGLPPGVIIPWVGSLSSIPSGFLYCNNSSYNTTTYANLFAVIGTYYGSDSSSTFKVPELRGEVLRGADNGAGRDPDAASRTTIAGATETDTSKAGTYQADQFKSHTHFTVADYSAELGVGSSNAIARNKTGIGDDSYWLRGSTNTISSGITSLSGGDETRMRNMSVHWLIKY